MISLGLSHLLQVLTCILLLTPSFSEDDRKMYIVYMGEYRKGVEFAESLHSSMIESVLGRKFAPDVLLHSYKNFNAFVARLTKEEAVRMKGMDGVVSVIPNKIHNVQTSRSWDFLGFPENVPRKSLESNIVVGVIDSGIWPNSESFNPARFGPPPQKWKGSCHNFTCTNKIVGAKFFRIGGDFGSGDSPSPLDTNGHGTHCASTAAGNLVGSASLFELALGTARGGVPLARIAAYKVCWETGCSSVDIFAAFDEAISDGVDILSVSVGSSQLPHQEYFCDIFSLGAFHAMKNGILTSQSAGNNGPNLLSMLNTAPWLLSVAASTIDRKFITNLRLGNGITIQGISINTFDLKNKQYPLIYGGDAPNTAGGYNGSQSRHCVEGSLDAALVRGKIVLCEDNPSPTSVGFVSGAVGVIISSGSSLKVGADIYALPAIQITESDGRYVYSYLKNSTSSGLATIDKTSTVKDSLAPYIAPFSSRGPNKLTPNLLKPDLAAPGVDILAAWPPNSPISGVKGDSRIGMVNYNIISGTSMACPHVTAAAAYVKTFHPTWSPAAIKSALMTTATSLNPTLHREAEFAYGAGQISPRKAADPGPGLVYDAGEIDYVKFLCGQGYSTGLVQRVTGDNSTCTQANKGSVLDLNLPSFALCTRLTGSPNATFHRTVTNVGSPTSRYTYNITAHSTTSLSFKVDPSVLSFTSLGQQLTFSLKVGGTMNAELISLSLVWSDGTYQVRSPIVVYTPEFTGTNTC